MVGGEVNWGGGGDSKLVGCVILVTWGLIGLGWGGVK